MKSKMEKVMHEYKTGKLHSGSKSGPIVKNRKQAIAIGMSEMMKKSTKGSPSMDEDEVGRGYRVLERCEGMAGGGYKE